MMDIHIRKTLTVQKNVGSSHIQYILEMMNTIIFSVSFHHSFNSLLVQLSAVSFGRHIQFSSVPVVSDSLPPHGLQHTRLPYSSPASRACRNSCPSSRWCHPTISSCCPLLLPSIFPSIRVFSIESVLRIRWPKYWSFSFSIKRSNIINLHFDMSFFCCICSFNIVKKVWKHGTEQITRLHDRLVVLENSWESLEQHRDQTSQS